MRIECYVMWAAKSNILVEKYHEKGTVMEFVVVIVVVGEQP